MTYLCGCYYHIVSTDYYTRYQRHYLPLLDSEVHSTILSTSSRTVLKQTFTNPSSTDNIKECIYTFPLYDGVSVVSFISRIGKKVLTGLVKEKTKAKEIFDQAVAKGETAGLLEQAPEASDVFSTKLGNIPAGESVIVEVTYIGELKHHENEGIRFTIPTKIAPRYGSGPSHGFGFAPGIVATGEDNSNIKIVVDVNMPEGSFIKGVQSPSHPIAVSMGTVSTATRDQPVMSKASATLSLGSASLDQDFVLIVQSKDVGTPKAILEVHPTIPNHRALMATLVPKFSLPPSRSEIVFVADRSGSMNGNIEMLISAMKVFLKSLPQNVKFNICSFGSRHSFLWQQSKTNSRDTLQEATAHLNKFSADMGGTETFEAIKGTIERRLKDIPLEIILLTDGDIHRQNDLFAYVNERAEETKGKIRVFPLGIGNGVSHALIEGLARAGNGFAQAVQHGERLDNAVIRMLRGALTPHITDYTLEVKYQEEIDDDYELIDRVTDGMKVLLTPETMSLKSSSSMSPKPTISLFDTTTDPEKDAMKEIQDTTFSLSPVPSPKLLQAPHRIPSLFAFSRTTVYLLMSPETIQRRPIAVVLRGTSEHGPLALEISVEELPTPAETIHQLAAKKAVQDLEEGRGWIYDAKDQDGVLIKERYPSSFDDMVQREAVRLGEKFQIAGKWCSFVAVAANDKEIAEKKDEAAASAGDHTTDDLDSDSDYIVHSLDDAVAPSAPSRPYGAGFSYQSSYSSSVRRPTLSAQPAGGSALFSASPPGIAYRRSGNMTADARFSSPRARKRVMNTEAPSASAYGMASFSADAETSDEWSPSSPGFSPISPSYSPTSPPPPPYRSSTTAQGRIMQQRQEVDPALASQAGPPNVRFGPLSRTQDPAPTAFGGGSGFPQTRTAQPGALMSAVGNMFGRSVDGAANRGSTPPGMKGFRQRIQDNGPTMKGRSIPKRKMKSEVDDMDYTPTPVEVDWSTKTVVEKMLALIDLQDFEGFWPVEKREEISKIIGVAIDGAAEELESKIWITMAAVKFLEEKCGDEEGTWGLIVEKARAWMAGTKSASELEVFESRAEKLIVG
ncbi:uncharacterized protein LY89DRAFT_627904 [Mollisia scopiformis]|uniref:Uncharacterized protein n=1 Tax=Mollisia scopiformis TaxID=149040 RepID=A0A132BDE2_MOLSC|nr:uncharacterized protein LY89DRAFT_627904 [Mollisia scopiformis]KUJ09677.1 hypothetical protein LY89DRAFT_627904 [Mollisia scopiformis]